ncbi:MAG: ABC transporter substrate-binding protein [Chloroflexi bacterium]|nr:ABC transporter substrate-binding protein [Chloroflexota bacterium]
MMARQMFDALVTFDDQGQKIVPMLASSWKRIDNNTMEFTLRDDVKFSNGEPFDAEAVKFNVARLMNSKEPIHQLTKNRMASLLPDAEVVNSTTVRLKTKDPDPIFLNRMTMLFMLAPKYTAGGADVKTKPVGTGSFKVTDFQTTNHISLEAWDSWRGKSTVQTAKIQQITDVAAFVAALKAGDIDIAWNVQGDQVAGLKSDFNVGTQNAYSCTVSSLLPLIPAYADARVRQAVNLAVNKEELIKTVVGGFGQVAQGQLLAPDVPGFNDAIKAFPFDPDKAKSLLKEAGFSTFDVNFMTTSSTLAIVQAIAGYLKAVGINVKINQVELPVFTVALTQKTDQPMLAWNTDYFHLRDFTAAAERFAIAQQQHFQSDDFKKLYISIEQELDDTKRTQMIKQAEQMMYDQAAALFLSQRQFAVVYNKKIANLPLPYDTTVPLWKVQKAA